MQNMHLDYFLNQDFRSNLIWMYGNMQYFVLWLIANFFQTFNPLKIQRTGGTPNSDGVKSSYTKTQKTKSWTCHISMESWDSCDFNYVNI